MSANLRQAEQDYQVSSNNNGSSSTEKISFREKLGYGFGDFASNIVLSAVGAFLLFFYTDVIGAPAAAIGTIILVSRIFDGFTDIMIGAMVDKTKSKHGKARPWLLWMAVPYAISTILVFTVPDIGTVGMLIYIAITYNLLYLVYTAINVPYGVLNSLITQDQYQRSQLNIFRMFMALAGVCLVIFYTFPLVEAFGGGKIGWQLVFGMYGLVAGALFLYTFFTTKERVNAGNAQATENIPLKQGVKYLFSNKYWAMLVVFAVILYAGMGLGSGLNVYYASSILNDPALVGPLGLAGLLPILVGLLFVSPIIKKFGKRNASIGGMILGLVGTFVIAVDPTSGTLVLIGAVIRGIGLVPVVASIFSMFADTIEYGEWKTGARTEGLIYSAGSFGTKVGGGLGTAAIGWALSMGGYVGGAAEQSDTALGTIIFLFVWLPVIFSALQVLVLYFYKLDKEYPQILKELQQRKTN